MKLLTKEIIGKLPGPRAQENIDDPIVYVKFFHPLSNWTWFITEAWQVVVNLDGDFVAERPLKQILNSGELVEDIILFGKVIGHESEWGPVSFKELNNICVHGVKIERDKFFKPMPVSQCS